MSKTYYYDLGVGMMKRANIETMRGARIMNRTITDTPIAADHQHEAKVARVELLRRAEAQGIKPLTSLEYLSGDPALTADFDVEAFLLQVRADRDSPSGRNLE